MKIQKRLLLKTLLTGSLIVIFLFFTINCYNLKKTSLHYERTSIYMAKGLLTNYQEILNLEKEILETSNRSEKEKLEAAHRYVYNSMFEYRNSTKMLIFHEKEIHHDFNDLDLKISKAMLDFVQATSDEDKLSAYNRLDELLKNFSEFTDNMWDMLSIEEEVI